MYFFSNSYLKRLLILLLFFPLVSLAQPLKRDIKKLNNLFIFDFFINFEICQKNGNLATLADYIPDPNYRNFRQVTTESNYGGEKESVDFQYNENGLLEKFTYQVGDKYYVYEFVYEKNRLTKVLIGGKPKIYFKYDFFDRLLSITRETSSATMELNFSFVEGQNRANIKMFIIQNGKKEASKREYFISWNEIYKMKEYSFDVYSGKDFTYNENGDLISFTFSNVLSDKNQASWKYTYDNKGLWIEKTHDKIYFKRTIILLK